MSATQLQLPTSDYTSTNLNKHMNANPLQRWLLERFYNTAAGLLAQTDARTILDAGCGEGFGIRNVLRGRAATITGIDSSAGALQLAQAFHPHSGFTVGDLLKLPFPDKSFDLVMCMEVLEHIPGPERALQEIVRVSRRWLLLSVPNEPFFRGANFLRGKNVRAWGNDPGHVNHWPAGRFLRFISGQSRVIDWRRSFPWTLALCRVD